MKGLGNALVAAVHSKAKKKPSSWTSPDIYTILQEGNKIIRTCPSLNLIKSPEQGVCHLLFITKTILFQCTMVLKQMKCLIYAHSHCRKFRHSWKRNCKRQQRIQVLFFLIYCSLIHCASIFSNWWWNYQVVYFTFQLCQWKYWQKHKLLIESWDHHHVL